MNVFAKFDEIPSMIQDIKETKRYGHTHTHGRKDGRENSIPTHKHSLQGYNYDRTESEILHTQFRGNRSASSRDFTLIWAWRPLWSCDLDAANKLWFPLPMEAPHKIWL